MSRLKIRVLLLFLVVSCSKSPAADEWQMHALSNELLNPAQLSIANQREVGLSVYNRFQLSELNTGSLYAKYPNQWLDAGVKVSTFGYEEYQLLEGQVSVAKKVFANVALGINITVVNENSVLEEASKTYFSSGLGAFGRWNERFDWAFLVEHALGNLPGEPVNWFGGCTYKPVEFAAIFLEGSYNQTEHFNLSIGLEYEILGQFSLRSGLMTATGMPNFGAGYRWKQWRADVGFSLHPELGTSSIIGIRRNF
ncbi:MAG: hypothetical protein LBN93_04455 [Candidatus Symbiothrix sp.]|nr:hypothetical protein [Candidatus Symbiothrix sp.]